MGYFSYEYINKTTCIINGKIMDYDLCSEDIKSYNDWKRPIKYLGYGKIYSVNNVKQNFTKNHHFWIFK